MEDTNPGAGSTLDDVSGVFLTEARIANGKFPLREINDMEPVVSGISQMSQSTLLMKKRKEMREIDDALDFMKEEYAQRMEACDTRQRELERKQAEMKEQVTRFEKFIKENDSKRTRAELKCKSEHRLGEVNEARKRQLVMQLEKDGSEREALERKRDQLLKYRQYLEAAVEASDGEYEEIGDILNRHATLVDTNNDLKAQVRTAEVETDQLRQRIRALKVEMQNLVLVQNSSIHGQQQQLETLRSEAQRLDLDRQRNDRVANDRSRESGQIVLTVTNLYSRLNLGDKLPVLREQDMDVAQYIQSLLKVIAARIVDLDYIVSNYKDQTPEGWNIVIVAATARLSTNRLPRTAKERSIPGIVYCSLGSVQREEVVKLQQDPEKKDFSHYRNLYRRFRCTIAASWEIAEGGDDRSTHNKCRTSLPPVHAQPSPLFAERLATRWAPTVRRQLQQLTPREERENKVPFSERGEHGTLREGQKETRLPNLSRRQTTKVAAKPTQTAHSSI